MIILSQNKKYLLDTDNLYIEYCSEVVDGKVTVGYFIRSCKGRFIFLMGIYSTEEKAKKVVEMEKDKINYLGTHTSDEDRVIRDYADVQYHLKMKEPVFEMPQDNEVE